MNTIKKSPFVYTRVTRTAPHTFWCESFALPSAVVIRYGVYTLPLGSCLLAHIGGMVCFLGLSTGEHEQYWYDAVVQVFRGASMVHDQESIDLLGRQIFDLSRHHTVTILLAGTAFQTLVWTSLLQIPAGQTITYRAFAEIVARPRAVRAVASAIGRNNISYLVPCHRVISSNGRAHKYRWGTLLKQRLLDDEREVSMNS